MTRPPTKLETIRALVREQRRTCLKARTIVVSLRSALADFQAISDTLEPEEIRFAMRRAWCERAATLLLDLRADLMRAQGLGRGLMAMQAPGSLGRLGGPLNELELASEAASRAIEQGEAMTQAVLRPAS